MSIEFQEQYYEPLEQPQNLLEKELDGDKTAGKSIPKFALIQKMKRVMEMEQEQQKLIMKHVLGSGLRKEMKMENKIFSKPLRQLSLPSSYLGADVYSGNINDIKVSEFLSEIPVKKLAESDVHQNFLNSFEK